MKINKKEIIKNIKDEKKEKRNITFRFEEELIDDFSKACDKESVSMSKVITEFMKSFIK